GGDAPLVALDAHDRRLARRKPADGHATDLELPGPGHLLRLTLAESQPLGDGLAVGADDDVGLRTAEARQRGRGRIDEHDDIAAAQAEAGKAEIGDLHGRSDLSRD